LAQTPSPIPNKPGLRTSWKLDRQALLKLVQAQPDLLLKEIADTLQVSVSCVGATQHKLNIKRKKTLRYAQAFKPHQVIKRQRYLKRIYLAIDTAR
jgi:hypothetical protein